MKRTYRLRFDILGNSRNLD
ncbi:TPA: hypothetical protein N0F65_007018 [Lagenidium giganteum]|uniref:Uncharacterized protein n=1 Tax=Lagenidium giganteum TaxID=4803 RepID=A0AAV2ZG21_9STRA|nr:TPA: hypothetical protein N0F65_007018 [Lagenidium giganteum]